MHQKKKENMAGVVEALGFSEIPAEKRMGPWTLRVNNDDQVETLQMPKCLTLGVSSVAGLGVSDATPGVKPFTCFHQRQTCKHKWISHLNLFPKLLWNLLLTHIC